MPDKSKPAFRPEIEGLRAIAAMLVAVFHIWLGRVSGGVDVFFVVSSFLITIGLLGQLDRFGRIDYALVWGRLARRLLPVAYLVLCCVGIAAVLMLPKSRWKDSIEQVAASAVYLENWLLAHHSVDYLARHRAVSPVQHFWALSVQGQFYLVWPLLVGAVAFAARRMGVAVRRLLIGTLLVLFAASLAYSVHLTHHNQPFAYFNTLARGWEFCIGALLAIVIPYIRPPGSLRLVLGWLGVLAIVSCGFVFQVSRAFPGYAALWPNMAAVAIIVAGTSGSRLGADRFLGSRWMVYLGGISYGIYLWHFPILAFARLHAEPGQLDPLAGLAVLAASVALAALSTRFIEESVRNPRAERSSPLRPAVVAIACAIPLLVDLTCWSGDYWYHRHRAHSVAAAHPGQGDYPGALARKSNFNYHGSAAAEVFPGPLEVADDREVMLGKGCDLAPEATMPALCRIAGVEGMYTVAVVGGSHSSQWLPALQMIAEQSGWQVLSFTKSDCPFYLNESAGDNALESCGEWNSNVIDALLRLHPDAVFMTSTRFESDDEFVPDGYVSAWEKLSAANIKVLALRDNPDFEFDVSACVELHGANSPACALPRARVLEVPSPTALLKNAPTTVHFLDLSNYFCDETLCAPVIGNVLVYRHMNHLTATYVRSLAPMLDQVIKQALLTDAPQVTADPGS